jgi:hypothetical protein
VIESRSSLPTTLFGGIPFNLIFMSGRSRAAFDGVEEKLIEVDQFDIE